MRPIIADDDYLKSILRDGAGHRVGIQNLPAGGPTPDLPIYRSEEVFLWSNSQILGWVE